MQFFFKHSQLVYSIEDKPNLHTILNPNYQKSHTWYKSYQKEHYFKNKSKPKLNR